MNTQDVVTKMDSLGRHWEAFKAVNDRRLAELERKGQSDSLYEGQLQRLNQELDKTQQELKALQTSMFRPAAAGVDAKASYSGVADGYGKAFSAYLRKGVEDTLAQLETKALSAGSNADGGYLVTPAMSEWIARHVQEVSPLRKLARVETITTDALDVVEDYDAMASGWTTETGTVSDTTTAQINKRNIPLHELYAQPKATQKLVDDAAVDIEQWVAQKVAESFAKLEGAAFIAGDGSGKPKGILGYAAGTSWGQIEQVDSGEAGVVTADALVNLFYALEDQYAARATFLMHRSTLQQVRLLKDGTTGQYLWTPGLASGQPDTLLGVPVMTAVDMPVPAANSLSVALGDFYNGYQIVDRVGVRILRDPFTEKPFVKFYSTKRVGGAVVNYKAVKLLKLAA